MPAVTVRDLVKTYTVGVKKGEGLLAAAKGLFRRETKEVRAVAGVRDHLRNHSVVGRVR